LGAGALTHTTTPGGGQEIPMSTPLQQLEADVIRQRVVFADRYKADPSIAEYDLKGTREDQEETK